MHRRFAIYQINIVKATVIGLDILGETSPAKYKIIATWKCNFHECTLLACDNVRNFNLIWFFYAFHVVFLPFRGACCEMTPATFRTKYRSFNRRIIANTNRLRRTATLNFQTTSPRYYVRHREHRQDPVGASRLLDCRLAARLLYHQTRSSSER